LRVRQIALLELLRYDARFHDGAVEQIALHVEEARLGLQRLLIGADDFGILHRAIFAVLGQRLASDRQSVTNLARLHQLVDHRRDTSGTVIFLAEILARWLQIDEKRNLVADALPIVVVELYADMPRDGIDVDGRIGGAADRRIDDDNVLER